MKLDHIRLLSKPQKISQNMIMQDKSHSGDFPAGTVT